MDLPSKDRIVFSSCYLDDDDTLWVAPGDIASVPHKASVEHCRQLDINWGNFAKFLKLVNFLGVDISDIMCSSEESASEDERQPIYTSHHNVIAARDFSET